MYMNHAWNTVVLTTKTAVAVSWSIAFSVGITMKVVWDADAEPKQAGRCRTCGLPIKPETK
jgi:hypothetical protein